VQENAAEVARRTPAASRGSDRPAHHDPAPGSRKPSCAGPQAKMFFSEDPREVEHAKRLCASCSGRSSCLAGALERREPWGVWGGELFQAGAVIPQKSPRGRPRRHR
jgi:WhiB family transcriptional regulator, redox-sensing transcriptional regulator